MLDLNSPAEVEHVVRVVQLTKWCNMSSVVMYIYELLITFDEEVNLIWYGVSSPGKALFLLLRYLTLASLIFIVTVYNLPVVSSELFVMSWIAGSLIGLMAHLTLELRLYVMFNKSRGILVLLVVATIAVAASMFGIFIKIIKEEGAEFMNIGKTAELHMCLKTNVPGLVKIFWIPILVGEAVLVGLAVFKGVQMQGAVLNGWLSDRAPYGFLRFLVRDSVLFFLMVFASFLATELVWVIAGIDYIEVPVGFAIASSSIWSQRLLLNIRKHRIAPVDDFLVTVDSDIPEFTNHDILLETFRNIKTERGETSPR